MSTGALTVTGAVLDGEEVGVRCVEGTIAALGRDVVPERSDETIDAAGAPLVAPLLNGHTHAAMTLFRGYGGDLPLMRWLQEAIWPVEGKLEPEDVYWGTRLACLEMIRTGTARFWDMYWHPGATARAVIDAGLRAMIGGPLFDADGGTEAMRATALESLEELAGFGPRIGAALAPHSIYTVSEELLRWTGERSAERELPIQIHLSETEDEVRQCLEEHDLRPAAYLDTLGVLSERTVLAHGVWLDREELALIAERGCTVVTNPAANMKLAVGGVFPYPTARTAGVAVGLGTDGAGSNDSLDLFSDLKIFALAQRHAAGDPTVLPAREAWSIATGATSPLLSSSSAASADSADSAASAASAASAELHQLVHPADRQVDAVRVRVGGAADFLLLRADSHELSLGDLRSDLVYAASGAIVDTMVVGGRVLMRDGEVPGSEEVVARAVECSRRLGIEA